MEMPSTSVESDTLRMRLDRERRIRQAAEAIAEEATRRLYEMNEALERARKELEDANRAQSDFIAIASHELQTPITPILGFAQQLNRQWDSIGDATKREYAIIVERQARRLALLSKTLLTVSRLEAGRLRAQSKPFEISSVLERAVLTLDDPTRFALDISPNLRVCADPDQTEQILTNFMTNALRYGASPFWVEARSAGSWTEVRVRDAGKGVPPEFIPRLFEKFTQADLGRTGNGTGLGLYIARGLARAQSGDAWYEKDEKGGACFAFKLPAAGEEN